jgi:hypothetical protein
MAKVLKFRPAKEKITNQDLSQPPTPSEKRSVRPGDDEKQIPPTENNRARTDCNEVDDDDEKVSLQDHPPRASTYVLCSLIRDTTLALQLVFRFIDYAAEQSLFAARLRSGGYANAGAKAVGLFDPEASFPSSVYTIGRSAAENTCRVREEWGDSLIKLKSALTVNTHPDAVDTREDSEFQRKIKDPESATLWSVTIWGWT